MTPARFNESNQMQHITKPILTAALICVATTVPTFAALSPGYQRAAELRAVTEAAADIFGPGGETIVSIQYLDQDKYEAASENCTRIVNIIDLPTATGAPAMVGPRQFNAAPENIIC